MKRFFPPMKKFLTPVQLLPNMIAIGFSYISDKAGIFYKVVLTGGLIVLIDRQVGPVVSDILNPPSIPQGTASFHGCGLKRLAGRSCQYFFQSCTSLGGYDVFQGEVPLAP